MNLARPPANGFDRAGPVDVQDVWDTAAIRRGHLRVRTLVAVRWMVLGGEVLLLLFMRFGLGEIAPYLAASLVVGAGIAVNALIGLIWPRQKVLRDDEAVIQLTFDILQLSALLALIGGTANPFCLLLIAPVTLAAATLPQRQLYFLGGLASFTSLLLATFSLPYPAATPEPGLTLEYRVLSGFANVAGIALVAGYVRQSVVEAARIALALDVTQTVLAREQRLSALGALAAAAAHELGTPLATIAIVSKEMAREATTLQVKEDAELLISQAQRCRDILQRLASTPDQAADALHQRLSLRQLLQEVTEPHLGASSQVRIETAIDGARDVETPEIRRLPEINHAFSTFVENAVDFAVSEIVVTARFDRQTITLEVRDDGPGFSPEILAKLGEPYVTSRPDGQGSRTGHIGLGLGFFIAKTLLERTGASVTYENHRPHGARIAARWRRPDLELI